MIPQRDNYINKNPCNLNDYRDLFMSFVANLVHNYTNDIRAYKKLLKAQRRQKILCKSE